MLDTKSLLVLKILQNQIKGGNYKVVEKIDIISSLPKKYKCEVEELEHIVSYLERQDCVSVKYDDDEVFCLCVLPYSKNITTPEKKEKKKVPFLFASLIFIISFLGALLGSLLSAFLL